MSKHHRHKHKHHHRRADKFVDWERHRLYHEGREYKFEPYTSSITPCKWIRIDRRGHREFVEMKYELEELDKVLLYAFATQDDESVVASESSESSHESAGGHKIKKETPWQKHTNQGPRKKGQRVERTKYGVRAFSVDGKTWWDFCVNNSNTYHGSAAMRITLPPPRKDGNRWHMAVFDLETMEAIRRELARGPKPKRS